MPARATAAVRIRWDGDEEELWPVSAESAIWVADRDTTEVGYRTGRIEILVDRDTVRAGQTAPVILSSPVPDVWVLFSVGGEGDLVGRHRSPFGLADDDLGVGADFGGACEELGDAVERRLLVPAAVFVAEGVEVGGLGVLDGQLLHQTAPLSLLAM